MYLHKLQALKLLSLAVVAGLAALALVPTRPAKAAPAQLSTEDLLKKARCDGKYSMLLAQIKVEKDAETYSEFKDFGLQNKREYAGHTNLPKGYWVYAAPYWYIWRDLTAVQNARPKRAWGSEQATGEPDTNAAGDIQTAWASQTQDGQDEWLLCEYDEPIVPTAVLVYETYNPGALYRVTVFKLDGEEVEVWKGNDPTPADSGKGVSEIPVKVDFKTNRVKIHLASKDVPGWNEIDAVGVRDKAKKMHWAVAVEASSNYAQPYPQTDLTAQINEDRIRRLEEDVRQLKASIEELKKLLKEKDKK